MKQYSHIGNVHEYITKDCFWKSTRYEAHPSPHYIYEYSNQYWLYTMNRTNKLKMSIEMCKAIEELHSYNIIHCDIKLKNMLYHTANDLQKYMILFDFGGSIHLQDKQMRKVDSILGTTGYMPLDMEQGIITYKGDIYSLGVCILEVWVGEIWKDGKSYHECRKEVLHAMKQLKDKEPTLAKIIKRCIDTTIEKRPYCNTLLKNLIHLE